MHLGEPGGKRALLVGGEAVDEATALCAKAAPGELRLCRRSTALAGPMVELRVSRSGRSTVLRVDPAYVHLPLPQRSALEWDERCAPYVPAAVLDALRSAAYDSFLTASHVTYLVSVSVVVVAAVLVAFALPVITPPRKDAVVPDDSSTDDLVREEEAAYPEQLTEEISDDGRKG
jgi:hypothetical protein